ncbi:MAG: malate dehydrogenase [archaeon]|nr:malate dehydrogenase [archaeon]MCP8306528.1 malate dehydrogenase [archaeon]
MIGIIGLGKVGSTVAEHLVLRELDDLVLIDIVKGLPQGNALDLSHMASELDIEVKIKGSNDYKDLEGSDIVILTAGFPRTSDMSRLDLLQKNKAIIEQISSKVMEYAPKSKVIVVTNPLDTMTYLSLKITGFDRNHLFGVGSELDAARLTFYLSSTLNIPRSSIDTFVIGEHGDSMTVLGSHSKVDGVPVKRLLNPSEFTDIVDKLKKSGAEVISLKGSTTFGIAAATSSIVESVIKDKREVHLVSFYLDGEYGFRDVCIGVPAIIGKNGVERVIELKLDEDEEKRFKKSVEVLKKSIELLMEDEMYRGYLA